MTTTKTTSKETLHPVTKGVLEKAFGDLSDKLLDAQIKYGLTEGCLISPPDVSEDRERFFVTTEGCIAALKHHLQKGDVLDSMAYLTFLNHLEGGSKVALLTDAFSGDQSENTAFGNKLSDDSKDCLMRVSSDLDAALTQARKQITDNALEFGDLEDVFMRVEVILEAKANLAHLQNVLEETQSPTEICFHLRMYYDNYQRWSDNIPELCRTLFKDYFPA